MIELIVEFDPILEREDYWRIEVRCATDIKKGDRFITVVPYTTKLIENNTKCLQNEGTPFGVDLVVDRIRSYEKEWDILYAGMTAMIFFNGDASKIKARAYLRDILQ
ncbi:hypothetical protein ACIPF8_00035 [Collimonas sp. NPDC087041]|uniref:hypothetical protein n=1 Tax=Collimonas sp. NPDC087041 TaxID=3363960 RepID=UPI00382B0E52